MLSIIKIIKYDLQKLNLEYQFITNDAGRVAIILPKDAFVESVLEDIGDQNISKGIIEYKSTKMEGNPIKAPQMSPTVISPG